MSAGAWFFVACVAVTLVIDIVFNIWVIRQRNRLIEKLDAAERKQAEASIETEDGETEESGGFEVLDITDVHPLEVMAYKQNERRPQA